MQGLMGLPLIVGPFSGVNYEQLTETPMLSSEAVLEMAAGDLIGHGKGMAPAERGGEAVALTVDGTFSWRSGPNSRRATTVSSWRQQARTGGQFALGRGRWQTPGCAFDPADRSHREACCRPSMWPKAASTPSG